MSPAINGFTSKVQIQALAVRLRRLVLMRNRSWSMLVNESSIRMVAASRIQKILLKQNSCDGGCQENIPSLNCRSTVHHSALLIIAIVQACLKLENTIEIIALASAVQKQSRKYCILVACLGRAH